MLSSAALMSSGVPESWVVVAQALLATLMTWGLTAAGLLPHAVLVPIAPGAGAAVVFLLEPQLLPDPAKDAKFKKSILDGMLGFAAGVMLAASYWSLLAPSIDAAAELGYAGCAEPHAALDKDACIEQGAQWSDWSWFPAMVGLMAGAIALSLTDKYLPTDMVSTVMGSQNEQNDLYDPKRKPAGSTGATW
jgi:ZIP family zinc transporter